MRYRTPSEAAEAWRQSAHAASIKYVSGLRGLPPEMLYEAARERYVNGDISLEDFTAQVVQLLREGL